MKIEIVLNEDDYLNQQLFAASKSKTVRKNRRNTIIMLIAAFSLVTISEFLKSHLPLPWWVLLILGLLFILWYPRHQRNVYIKHYRKHISEYYKHRFGKLSQIEFLDGQLLIKDYVGEARLDLAHADHLYETRDYFYVKFETAEVLILPKGQLHLTEFSAFLRELSTQYTIPFTQDLNWKWR